MPLFNFVASIGILLLLSYQALLTLALHFHSICWIPAAG